MGDDIQTHALFILRAGDEPRRRAVSVAANMASRAAVYSSQRLKDLMSIGESFQILRPSSMRSADSAPAPAGDLQPVLEQNNARFDHAALHHRRAVEELLHLLRRTKAHHPFDAGAVIPAAIENHDFAGRREMLDIALKVELAFSRSVGEGKATTRKIRGLTRSVMALMVPPFPAPSRPSKTMHTFSPLCTTQRCSFTSSTWSLRSAFSYALLSSGAILPPCRPDYRFSCCPSPCSVLPRYPFEV